jgi:hypothetical protein
MPHAGYCPLVPLTVEASCLYNYIEVSHD